MLGGTGNTHQSLHSPPDDVDSRDPQHGPGHPPGQKHTELLPLLLEGGAAPDDGGHRDLQPEHLAGLYRAPLQIDLYQHQNPCLLKRNQIVYLEWLAVG